MGVSILTKLSAKEVNSRELVKKWHSVKGILMRDVSEKVTIDAAVCEEFRFDLEGLFRRHLKIPEDLILPTMLVNGYNCSQSYSGKQNTFFLIGGSDAPLYAQLFRREMR